MTTKSHPKSVTRPKRRPIASARRDTATTEELRVRVVLDRVRSPALAAVIASLAYSVPETWRAGQ